MTFAVREARTTDLPEMANLLAERDREDGVRAPASYDVAVRQLAGLDPSRCRAFVAVDAGGRVVAMNAALLRTLRAGRQTIPAAYWTNLYVHPEHRNAMLYPRVVTPLRKTMADEGRLLYTAVRREAVARAHERIGFTRMASLPLFVKPLRPMRLLAQRFRLFRSTPDRAPRAAQAPTPVAALQNVADLMERLSGDRIAPAWTAAELGQRLDPIFEGDVAGVHMDRGAAVIWLDATRMRGTRFRVILDLVAENGTAAKELLASCERDADADADAMLSLHRGRGYLKSGAEYVLLADRKSPVDITGKTWRFTLLEHDAF